MNEEIQQSISEVARAIESLNRAFAKHANSLEGGDLQELEQWIKATQAMRDSGNIYLSWARHYARVPGAEGAAEEPDLDDLLDEGGVWPLEQHP